VPEEKKEKLCVDSLVLPPEGRTVVPCVGSIRGKILEKEKEKKKPLSINRRPLVGTRKGETVLNFFSTHKRGGRNRKNIGD